MIYKLEYREKGEKKVLDIEIDFVSNYFLNRYYKLAEAMAKVQRYYEQMNENVSKIAALQSLNKKENKEKIKELKKTNVELVNKINEIGQPVYFQKRFDLLMELFESNGIKEEKVFDYDFWDRQVDPKHIIKILAEAANKDMPKKKM
jgi:hypothetical protein